MPKLALPDSVAQFIKQHGRNECACAALDAFRAPIRVMDYDNADGVLAVRKPFNVPFAFSPPLYWPLPCFVP